MPIIQRIALRGSLIFWRSFNMVPSFGSQILVQGMTFLGMYRTIQSVLSPGTFPVFPVKPESSNLVNLLTPGPPGPENSLSLPHSNSLTPSLPLPLSPSFSGNTLRIFAHLQTKIHMSKHRVLLRVQPTFCRPLPAFYRRRSSLCDTRAGRPGYSKTRCRASRQRRSSAPASGSK